MPLLWVNAKSSNINKGTRKFILAPELQFLNCLQEKNIELRKQVRD